MDELERRDRNSENRDNLTTAYTTSAVGVALLVAAVTITAILARLRADAARCPIDKDAPPPHPVRGVTVVLRMPGEGD